MKPEQFSLLIKELPQSWNVKIKRPKVNAYSVDTAYLTVVARTMCEATEKVKAHFGLEDSDILEAREEWKALL